MERGVYAASAFAVCWGKRSSMGSGRYNPVNIGSMLIVTIPFVQASG